MGHYHENLLSLTSVLGALQGAAASLQTEGWRRAEDRSQFLRGLLTPDFKGPKQSHCHCYWWSLIPGDQECVCEFSVVGKLHLKTVDVKGTITRVG